MSRILILALGFLVLGCATHQNEFRGRKVHVVKNHPVANFKWYSSLYKPTDRTVASPITPLTRVLKQVGDDLGQDSASEIIQMINRNRGEYKLDKAIKSLDELAGNQAALMRVYNDLPKRVGAFKGVTDDFLIAFKKATMDSLDSSFTYFKSRVSLHIDAALNKSQLSSFAKQLNSELGSKLGKNPILLRDENIGREIYVVFDHLNSLVEKNLLDKKILGQYQNWVIGINKTFTKLDGAKRITAVEMYTNSLLNFKNADLLDGKAVLYNANVCDTYSSDIFTKVVDIQSRVTGIVDNVANGGMVDGEALAMLRENDLAGLWKREYSQVVDGVRLAEVDDALRARYAAKADDALESMRKICNTAGPALR